MSNEATIRRGIEALNRHDAASFAGIYAEDAVLHDPQYRAPLRGRDAARKDVQDFLSAFPDLQMRLEKVISSGAKLGPGLSRQCRQGA